MNYNQQTQQASSATSRTWATPYTYQNTSVNNNDALRQCEPTHMTSPKVNQSTQQSRKVAAYKSPPITYSTTNATLNAPSYPQTSHGYSSYTATRLTAPETSSAINQDYPQVTEAATTTQTSPIKGPKERARAAEAEMEARRKEVEVQAQAEAVARAAEEALAAAGAQATPTSATKGKSTNSKPAKKKHF
ncbi:hypothetical protein TSTA_020130 [Talaromyces stipitatus ATCC 10500]|uniref:Uncharacterized protein n=1 Tax=Talaromyces stipitatus (strain ATCC 10500 / CBS 375.48 / QM 6759 / NRRL 1006) TaxID=441959 RepID=B8MES1_TALSN|nr:uncharacterized protein TSTA_020130 [Talaromyces stipitatus ATCC 10500]EED16954.1 hypothetical protein TSTA_020130 [Talaromyces stipitatus ATCC 10500]